MEIEGRLLFWIWFTRKYFMFHLLQVPRIPWFDLMCHQKNITWKKQNEHWLLRGKVFIAYPIPNTFARKFCTLKVKFIACYTNKLPQKFCIIGKTITKNGHNCLILKLTKWVQGQIASEFNLNLLNAYKLMFAIWLPLEKKMSNFFWRLDFGFCTS